MADKPTSQPNPTVSPRPQPLRPSPMVGETRGNGALVASNSARMRCPMFVASEDRSTA